MSRPSLYESNVKPYLEHIKGWLRKGITQEKIAEKLNISYMTLTRYRDSYVEFREILNTSRDLANTEMESAVFRTGTGYKETLKKPIKMKRVYYDAHNRRCEEEYVEYYDEEIFIFPNIKAQQYWLNNRCPEDWKNDAIEVVNKEVNNLMETTLALIKGRELEELDELDREEKKA